MYLVSMSYFYNI